MARAKVVLNHRGMGALLVSSGVRADMMRRAVQVAAAAKASAPVATGAYQASIHAETATTDRAVGRIIADAPYALVLEARVRTLGTAIDAAG